MTRELELELDLHSSEYKKHQEAVRTRLSEAAAKLEEIILFKNQNLEMRTQEGPESAAIYKAAKDFQAREAADCEELKKQR